MRNQSLICCKFSKFITCYLHYMFANIFVIQFACTRLHKIGLMQRRTKKWIFGFCRLTWSNINSNALHFRVNSRTKKDAGQQWILTKVCFHSFAPPLPFMFYITRHYLLSCSLVDFWAVFSFLFLFIIQILLNAVTSI